MQVARQPRSFASSGRLFVPELQNVAIQLQPNSRSDELGQQQLEFAPAPAVQNEYAPAAKSSRDRCRSGTANLKSFEQVFVKDRGLQAGRAAMQQNAPGMDIGG